MDMIQNRQNSANRYHQRQGSSSLMANSGKSTNRNSFGLFNNENTDAAEDLNLNSYFNGLDLDFSTPRRLSSNGNNSIFHNDSVNGDNAASSSGSEPALGANPKRVSFGGLDFNSDANNLSGPGPSVNNAASSSSGHNHSWSLATSFSTGKDTLKSLNFLEPHSRLGAGSANGSRFANHSSSRSVSNPLYSGYDAASNNGAVAGAAAGAVPQPAAAAGAAAGGAVSRNFPLNEIDSNMLSAKTSAAGTASVGPTGAAVSSQLPTPLWQKNLNARFSERNNEHKRSWSIPSFSTINTPKRQEPSSLMQMELSNSSLNSRENSVGSNDDSFSGMNSHVTNGSSDNISSESIVSASTGGSDLLSLKYQNSGASVNSANSAQQGNYVMGGMYPQASANVVSNLTYRPMDQYGVNMSMNMMNNQIPVMNQYGYSIHNANNVANIQPVPGNVASMNGNVATNMNVSNGMNIPAMQHSQNMGMNVRKNYGSMKRRGDDASKFLNTNIDNFKGQIYSLCKDQHGCRFLQRQLDLYSVNKGEESAEGELQENHAATLIFNEINGHIVELMTDQFGNYLIQKLLDQISGQQRLILIQNSFNSFIKISLNSHGTRALQKLIDVIDTQEENLIIIKAFEQDIVSLSRDLNGNHVVQKILTKFNGKPENIQFIFDAACENCIKISTHRHGCCVLQRCLDYGSPAQCRQLSLVIAGTCLTLALDPFGNYVVQYVLAKGDATSVKIIVDSVLKKILQLSTHKFGSNVIEKILKLHPLSNLVIDEILKNSEGHQDSSQNVFLNKLIHDPYGNYVLQTVLDVAEKPAKFNRLSELIKPILPTVRNTAQGRRIAAKVNA